MDDLNGARDELAYYRLQAEQQLLPFWRKAVDEQFGGVFTCFTNSGESLLSTDKFTWSQGRFLWLWSRIASLCSRGLLQGEADAYIRQARKTFHFLDTYAFLPDGSCSFLLTREGEHKEALPGEGYHVSFYADCFVVLGYAEFARVTLDRSVLDKAYELYLHIEQRLLAHTARSEPYPIPAEYDAHGFSMIMLNVSQELANAMEALDVDDRRCMEVRKRSEHYLDEIMLRFVTEQNLIPELLPRTSSADPNTLLARHINPGHTIECMWFVITEARKCSRDDLIARAMKVTRKAIELGWDDQYGGLYRYVDREGGRPRSGQEQGQGQGEGQGEGQGGEPSKFARLVDETWDMKLWWPHSEALYTTLLCYELSGDSYFKETYQRLRDYTFRIFPNPDEQVGEWIQIRNRIGEPVNTVAALPVKDPYHILRNILLIIELLDERLVEEKA